MQEFCGVDVLVFSLILISIYRGFALLIIVGASIVLLSKEGVMQGVPSALKLYSIGLLPVPLALKLKYSSEFFKTKWRKHDKEILKQLEQNESQHIAAFRQFPQWTHMVCR